MTADETYLTDYLSESLTWDYDSARVLVRQISPYMEEIEED